MQPARVIAALVLSSALHACATGAASGPPPPHYSGDPESRPSLEALPSSDVASSALSEEMRFAQMLSDQSLRVPDPPPPTGRSASELEQWSSSTLRTWIRQKQSSADAARKELDRAAVQDHRQRIMAGAMVGLVYEDLARVLLAVPAPDDLDSEPEILEMYRGILVGQATPYLTQARAAYEACAGNAVQLQRMEHWAAFCTERAARLPGGPKPELGEGTTTVTVVSE